MKLFLVLISAAVALFFTTSHSAIHWSASCHLRLLPLRCARPTAASNVPAAKDVKRVIGAAYRDHLDETLVNLFIAVNRAQKTQKGTAEWASEIEQGVPGLAQRVGELTDAARIRVAEVEVETSAGRRFRAIALRGLQLQGILYRAFARDLGAKRPTLKAFDRWAIRVNALHRWYLVRSQSVLDATAQGDRAAVEAALRRY